MINKPEQLTQALCLVLPALAIVPVIPVVANLFLFPF
jgi:hypothetical protein